MQLNLKKTNWSKERAISFVGNFWQKIYRSVLLIFLFALIALSAYIWNRSLSESEWGNEKKQEYLRAQGVGVTFSEDDFKKVLKDVESRRQEGSIEKRAIKNIFKSF